MPDRTWDFLRAAWHPKTHCKDNLKPFFLPLATRLAAWLTSQTLMIRSLKHAESYRTWLYREAAMAGRENQGNLWVMSLGIDLQPPVVCAGFRTLSRASLQTWSLGHRDARLMKWALDLAWTRAWWTVCLKGGSASSKWLYWEWGG